MARGGLVLSRARWVCVSTLLGFVSWRAINLFVCDLIEACKDAADAPTRRCRGYMYTHETSLIGPPPPPARTLQ